MSERHRDCDLVVVSRRCLSQSTTEERGDQATNATAVVRRVRESCALRVPPVPSVLHTGGSPVAPLSSLCIVIGFQHLLLGPNASRYEGGREGGRQQGGREGRQRTCGQRAGLSLPLHSLQSPREPSLRLPSTMSTKAKKRAAAAELGQRRGEESSQQRERRAL